ncbi:hypothetical protein KHA79_07025 [Xanthomonas translucens pv. cerealis]|nr:hypothetical protein KHA79_07025 [Xanthomonas translucens pv. cerealis]
MLAAGQDAAQQRRRIETQRLTLRFAETGSIFAAATAWAIHALARFVGLGMVFWWLVAWLRRRRRRVQQAGALQGVTCRSFSRERL